MSEIIVPWGGAARAEVVGRGHGSHLEKGGRGEKGGASPCRRRKKRRNQSQPSPGSSKAAEFCLRSNAPSRPAGPEGPRAAWRFR